jgi:hypothetical protein
VSTLVHMLLSPAAKAEAACRLFWLLLKCNGLTVFVLEGWFKSLIQSESQLPELSGHKHDGRKQC